MGGDLSRAPAGKSAAFMVRSLRDPDGANLDRVQIIKGWLDAKGGDATSASMTWPCPAGARSARMAAA